MRYKHSGQRDAGISKATVNAALFQPKAVVVEKKAPPRLSAAKRKLVTDAIHAMARRRIAETK